MFPRYLWVHLVNFTAIKKQTQEANKIAPPGKRVQTHNQVGTGCLPPQSLWAGSADRETLSSQPGLSVHTPAVRKAPETWCHLEVGQTSNDRRLCLEKIKENESHKNLDEIYGVCPGVWMGVMENCPWDSSQRPRGPWPWASLAPAQAGGWDVSAISRAVALTGPGWASPMGSPNRGTGTHWLVKKQRSTALVSKSSGKKSLDAVLHNLGYLRMKRKTPTNFKWVYVEQMMIVQSLYKTYFWE